MAINLASLDDLILITKKVEEITRTPSVDLLQRSNELKFLAEEGERLCNKILKELKNGR